MTAAELEDDSAPPALYDHCCRVYRGMLEEARSVQVNPDTEDESGEDLHIIVYEGFLTQLITGKLNLSVPYYTTTLKALKAMGCIRQLRRGGSSTPSQWELIYEPTLEAFMRQKPPKKPRQDRVTALEARIVELNTRLSAMEKWQGDVNRSLIKKLGTTPTKVEESV